MESMFDYNWCAGACIRDKNIAYHHSLIYLHIHSCRSWVKAETKRATASREAAFDEEMGGVVHGAGSALWRRWKTAGRNPSEPERGQQYVLSWYHEAVATLRTVRTASDLVCAHWGHQDHGGTGACCCSNCGSADWFRYATCRLNYLCKHNWYVY